MSVRDWVNTSQPLGRPSWLDRLDSIDLLTRIAVLFTACAIWIVTRCFIGIRDDGVLYLGQIMLHDWPHTIQTDVFFKYGSQDKFSIFSSVFSFVGRQLPWDVWPVAALALSQAAFLVALYLLMRRWIPDVLFALGLVLLAGNSYYGGFNLIAISENFFTARSVAEPLVLWGMLEIYLQRYGRSGAILALAAAFHPVMALPGCAVWALMFFQDTRYKRLTLALGALGAAAIAGLVYQRAGVSFFFDDAWWDAIMPINSVVDPYLWPLIEWAIMIFDVGIVIMAARLQQGRARAMLYALALSFCVALAISVLASETLRIAILTQAQLWRCHWLVHVVALCIFPWVVWRARFGGTLAWLGGILGIAALSFKAYETSSYSYFASLACLAAVVYLNIKDTKTFRILGALICVAVAAAALADEVTLIQYGSLKNLNFGHYQEFMRLSFEPACATILVCSMLLAALRFPKISVLVAAALLVASVQYWDQRGPYEQYMEARIQSASPFEKLIPVDTPVYWPEEQRLPWLVLHRPFYLSAMQGTGLVFNRATAMEYRHRQEIIDDLVSQDSVCERLHGMGEHCQPALDGLQEACAAPDGPRYFIFPEDIFGRAIAKWDDFPPVPGSRVKVIYYLYTCDAFPQGEAEPPAKAASR